MILRCWSLYGATPSPTSSVYIQSHKQLNLVLHQPYVFLPVKNIKSPTFRVTCLGAGVLDNIAQLAHNKVLTAASALLLYFFMGKILMSRRQFRLEVFRQHIHLRWWPLQHPLA
ncbi:hypothetical protein O6P43_029435 [Quillaja saponaria]|uniref:Uncharacterized protein n=1 Tax=Quillaja saponaria TaxID=32244 RepID=A0AAD7L1Y6_QUISA|nr:hypothetical protein O6P43_029435 [Quillaja saponaria]